MPKILIVEDEPLIAMTLGDMLEELGYEVVGNVARIEHALTFLRETDEVDGALLDVNVGHERIDRVADALAEKGCPFVFATGDGPAGLPPAHAGAPVVAKPFRMEELAAALAKLAPAAG